MKRHDLELDFSCFSYTFAGKRLLSQTPGAFRSLKHVRKQPANGHIWLKPSDKPSKCASGSAGETSKLCTWLRPNRRFTQSPKTL